MIRKQITEKKVYSREFPSSVGALSFGSCCLAHGMLSSRDKPGACWRFAATELRARNEDEKRERSPKEDALSLDVHDIDDDDESDTNDALDPIDRHIPEGAFIIVLSCCNYFLYCMYVWPGSLFQKKEAARLLASEMRK